MNFWYFLTTSPFPFDCPGKMTRQKADQEGECIARYHLSGPHLHPGHRCICHPRCGGHDDELTSTDSRTKAVFLPNNPTVSYNTISTCIKASTPAMTVDTSPAMIAQVFVPSLPLSASNAEMVYSCKPNKGDRRRKC